jgi:hypothetical protein
MGAVNVVVKKGRRQIPVRAEDAVSLLSVVRRVCGQGVLKDASGTVLTATYGKLQEGMTYTWEAT